MGHLVITDSSAGLLRFGRQTHRASEAASGVASLDLASALPRIYRALVHNGTRSAHKCARSQTGPLQTCADLRHAPLCAPDADALGKSTRAADHL